MKQYHLWREFPTRPFSRWAVTVVEDASVPDGFRIIDSDDSVVDGHFLTTLHRHLMHPHPVQASATEDGTIYDMHYIKHPTEPGYLAEAIRSTPGAYLRASGRPV